MAIREWYLEADVQEQTEEYFGYAMNFKYQDDDFIHVIDATGMPTKEEIREALDYMEFVGDVDKPYYQSYLKLFKWLEKLAAE